MYNHEPESSKEKRQHSTMLIPYSYYDCRIPDSFMNVPIHWHGEFELNYVLDGIGEFICGDDKFLAHKGDILIIPPNMLHAAYPFENNILSYDAFVFSPDMLSFGNNDRSSIECIRPIVNGFTRMKSHIKPSDSFYELCRVAIDNIFKCAAKNNSISDILIKSELLRIFWILETNHCIQPYNQDKISYSEIIRPALEYMTENFQAPITVEYLSELVNLSKSYFMSCFRKAAGIGAIEYLSQLRIKYACELLNDTNIAVADIALACGFNNLSNFNRQFKKMVGCSPLKYRNEISL